MSEDHEATNFHYCIGTEDVGVFSEKVLSCLFHNFGVVSKLHACTVCLPAYFLCLNC